MQRGADRSPRLAGDSGRLLGWAQRFEELGAGSLLYTNVDVEGLQEGVRFEPVRNLIGSVHIPVVVAGVYLHDRIVAGCGMPGATGSQYSRLHSTAERLP